MAVELPLSIVDVGARMRRGDLTPTDLVSSLLDRIDRHDGRLRSYGRVEGARALDHAAALERMLECGIDLGPLHGIPFAVKDNIDTAGIPTTSGSALHALRKPEADATVVTKLYAAGAIVLGKANLYEWALGAPSSLWGDTTNPWSPEVSSGGSSNGSAVAVAAGLALASLGTDFAGSIRNPAANCGVFGLKASRGRVSRTGTAAGAPTLDHVGPITRTARDAALVLDAIEGIDPADPATSGVPSAARALRPTRAAVAGTRIGVLHGNDRDLDPCVVRAYADAQGVFENLGCHVVPVALPDPYVACRVMWTIALVEAADHHDEQFTAHEREYDPRVAQLLKRGMSISGSDYVKSLRQRSEITEQLNRVFDSVDALLTPILSSPTPIECPDGMQDAFMIEATKYTALFSLSGHPAAALPAGYDKNGIPISLQIAGPLYADYELLNLAVSFEDETRHTDKVPGGLE